MSVFRNRRAVASVPQSPSLLIRDLHPRGGDIKFLWAHQEKLLDEYYQHHLRTPDIALELPTGSGKTLVGLLIAEYRRRVNQERIVYLCPTRQLCNQVKHHADQYGIPAVLLVGPQAGYSPQDFMSYQRAKATAITTYSGLFNVNPRIDAPEVILCDDAHASEPYIASLWTLNISGDTEPQLFRAITDLLWTAIPEHMQASLSGSGDAWWEHTAVDLVPAIGYADKIGSLMSLLDNYCENSNLQYSWSMIREHLKGCNVYVSPNRIQIRPVIAPTMTHAPFSSANQRLFMSATLGESGEMERTTGVRSIARLAAPTGSETHSTGRRLILFPPLFAEDTARSSIVELLRSNTRTLLLVKNQRELEAFRQQYQYNVQFLEAKDVEESLSAFTSSLSPTVLALANRYEGIDLPGDTCRQIILSGLPAGADLQERFFLQRLGAQAVLRNRIRTRLTQGMGRCTRDEGDYALVFVLGEDLLDWFGVRSNLASLHPELQAELEFGLEQSDDRTADEVRQMTNIFLNQVDEWRDADERIISYRNGCKQEPDPLATCLEQAAATEIDYLYAMWRGDLDGAYEKAVITIDTLAGGADLRPYRTYWHYTAASIAYHMWLRTRATSRKVDLMACAVLSGRAGGEINARLFSRSPAARYCGIGPWDQQG